MLDYAFARHSPSLQIHGINIAHESIALAREFHLAECGIRLSAIYWLTAALETKYAYEYTTDLFPYHESYITLLDVRDKGSFTEFFRVFNQVFVFGALALVVIVVVLRVLRRNQNLEAGMGRWTQLSMWMVMAIATTFMSTSFSIYISKLLPKIQVAVPAWRWLAIAGMFTSFLVAATVDLLRRRTDLGPRVLWACRIAFALIIALNLEGSNRSTIIKPLSNPTYHPAGIAWDKVESGLTPRDSTHPEDLADTQLAVTEPVSAPVEVSKRDEHLMVDGWVPERRLRCLNTARQRREFYLFRGEN